jgi:aminoethylphosphonate catabolism LysR family transcriptional regulator
MRYAQIKAFHHVALRGGFSRAAEALRLTQPALSDQVRRLETENDVVLFNRRKKQVTLTEAGRQLFEITRRLFEVEGQIEDMLGQARTATGGRLRIVADSPVHVLDALAAFRARHPNVQVTISTGNSEQVLAALYAYQADLGVLGEAPKTGDLHQVRLGASPLVAFAAKTSPVALRARIGLTELAHLPLTLREPNSRTRRMLEAAATRAGIELRATIEAEGREAIREIVATGTAVGVVSEAEFGHDPRLKKIAISGEPMLMEEALVCLKERAGGRLVKAFLEVAGAAKRQPPPPKQIARKLDGLLASGNT